MSDLTTSEQFALVLRTIYPGAAEAHAARAALQSIEEQVEFHKAAAAQNRDAYSRLFEQYAAAQREADIQLGEKLAAQMTLKAVCDVLNLPMVSLGNGWTEATPKILARIEEIVDEAERGFRERDGLKEQLEAVLGAVQSARTIAIHNAERHTGFVHIGRILADIEDTLSNPASSPESA